MTHEVNLVARDETWQETLAELRRSPIATVLDVTVEVAEALDGAYGAEVLLERSEPRTIWQTALSIQANLRGLGLPATVGAGPAGTPGEAALRVVLRLARDDERLDLGRVIASALAPVLARPTTPPPLPPPPRRVLAASRFEIVDPPRAPADEGDAGPPGDAAVPDRSGKHPPYLADAPEEGAGRAGGPGSDSASASVEAPEPAAQDRRQDTTDPRPESPAPSAGLGTGFAGLLMLPSGAEAESPRPAPIAIVQRVRPPDAEAVVGEILAVRAGRLDSAAAHPSRDSTPDSAPRSGPTKEADQPLGALAERQGAQRTAVEPERHQSPHPSAPPSSPAPPPPPSGPWAARLPGSGGVQPFPRPAPRLPERGRPVPARPGAPPRPPAVLTALAPPPLRAAPPLPGAPRPVPGPAYATRAAAPPPFVQRPVPAVRAAARPPVAPITLPRPARAWQAPARRVIASGAARRRG